jgi:hypothetical protein
MAQRVALLEAERALPGMERAALEAPVVARRAPQVTLRVPQVALRVPQVARQAPQALVARGAGRLGQVARPSRRAWTAAGVPFSIRQPANSFFR